jgi:hypothetical protein
MWLCEGYSGASRCGWTDYYIVYAENVDQASEVFKAHVGECPNYVDGPHPLKGVYYIGDSDDGFTGVEEIEEGEE